MFCHEDGHLLSLLTFRWLLYLFQPRGARISTIFPFQCFCVYLRKSTGSIMSCGSFDKTKETGKSHSMCKSQRSKVCEEIYHLTIVFNVFTITCIKLQLYIQYLALFSNEGDTRCYKIQVVTPGNETFGKFFVITFVKTTLFCRR